MERWLTVRDAATYAACSVRTIYRAAESGLLSGVKTSPGRVSAPWRFRPADVDRWLERGRVGRAS